MKKILSLTIALATFSATCFAQVANTPLSQQINKVLSSDEYCIRYQHLGANIGSNPVLAQNAFAKQPSKMVGMLAKKGTVKASITELYTNNNMLFSASMSIQNGNDVYVGVGTPVKGNVSMDSISKNPAEARKYINYFSKPSGNMALYESHIKSAEKMFLYYFPAFVTLEPSMEYVRLQDGTMQLRNSKPFCSCVHYSKTGTQVVDGNTYQFEEYVSDSKEGINEICRYYFFDGEFCKLVHTYSNVPDWSYVKI